MGQAWEPIAQAFVTWLGPQLGPLGLESFGLDAQTGPPHPRYPSRPALECPKLVLVCYTQGTRLLPAGRSVFDIDMGLWFYRTQETAGENYQEKVLEALDFLGGILDVQGQLPSILADSGARLMRIVQKIVHEELQHPLGEPRLRVNPAEIQLKFEAQT